mgnify:CR=1 FL=1
MKQLPMMWISPIEDRQKATSRVIYANPQAGEVVEVLEVRQFVDVGSVRLGEMTISLLDGRPVSMTISPQVL